jgi:asparagine synthase (glutamine-hydrolysing)
LCGIIGSNKHIERPERIVRTIAHRGKDLQQYVQGNNYFLGHARLSIIDLSENANQPMEKDGVFLVFNGEIYNYRELAKEEGFDCSTRSDSEVILLMYKRYGKGFLNKLNGMFSFAIYDKAKDLFFCARDRYGKKPFYYKNDGGSFYFSSEIKGVLSMINNLPGINEDALFQYLAFQSPVGSNTFYSGIKKLPAGHYLCLDKGGLEISKFYDLDTVTCSTMDEAEVLHRADELLVDAVKKRMVSDVKIASLISGGLDSSLISALYAIESGSAIETYSIGYDEYENYSELPEARYAASYIGTKHHDMVVGKDEYIEAIDSVLSNTDEPMADSASIPVYILSKKIASDGYKVCMSGEGSDELFLGYDNYFRMLEYYENESGTIEPYNLTKEWEFNMRKAEGRHVFQSSGETFSSRQLKKLFKDKDISENLHGYSSDINPVKWLSYIDFKIWIAEVLMTKIDRNAMASSLEIRTPFLDYRLVDFMFSVNGDIKRGDTNKYLLKKLSTKYLPEKIINRRKKGFSSPFIEWLYDYYGDEIYAIMYKVNRETGYFNNDFLRFLYEEGKEKRFKQHIYSLFLFSKWFQRVYM